LAEAASVASAAWVAVAKDRAAARRVSGRRFFIGLRWIEIGDT
jgi:hypothetical protein